MPVLHYGPQQFSVSEETAASLIKAIGAHASRGGWVPFTDEAGNSWSVLVSPGVPVFIDTVAERNGEGTARRTR
jgi:hypothetical protein